MPSPRVSGRTWSRRWPTCYAFGDFQAKNVPVLDLHELAAGKLAALFARGQARDLFDCHRILQMKDLDSQRLRIAFVVYGAMNRKDWRTVSLDDVAVDAADIARKLLPTIREAAADSRSEPAAFGERLVIECRSLLSVVLPFTDSEMSFLDRLLDDGVVGASILTPDASLGKRIEIQPLLECNSEVDEGGKRSQRRNEPAAVD